MKRFVSSTGGHPLQLDDINLLQTAYTEGFFAIADGLCKTYGNSGVYLTGGIFAVPSPGVITITPGWVYQGGVIYEVPAQTLPTAIGGQQYYWTRTTEVLAPSPVTYQDATTHNVHTRVKLVASQAASLPANSFPMSGMFRLEQIIGPPKYSIQGYYGSTADFDTNGNGKYGTSVFGWALCDGGTTNLIGGGTFVRPDFRARFFVGYDPRTSGLPSYGDTNYNVLDGASRPAGTGGEKTHLLTAAESGMPAHSHSMPYQTALNAGGSYNMSINGALTVPIHFTTINATTGTTGPVNASSPHENRPPYYAINWMIKLY